MDTKCPPQYDFKHPVFIKHPQFVRRALEHIEMCKLQSKTDCIEWEVKEATGPLNIPSVYHVHYHLRSIVGIDEAQNPLYGNHHILELSLPNRYPIEPLGIRMVTDAWHPNIKWDGKFKGRVCVNARDFGKSYMLYQLVLRVGEILQYKNYLAEFVPPFPEDAKVAEWVREFGEKLGIVDRKKGIVVDDTPLLRPIDHERTATPPVDSDTPPPPPAAPQLSPAEEPAAPPKEERGSGIRVTPRSNDAPPVARPKIIIGIKKDNPER